MKERNNQQTALQNGTGAISAMPYDRLVRSYQYALDSILHTMVLCWVFVMFFDGLITLKIGFDRTETIYYFFLLGLLVVRMLVVAIDRATVLYLTGLAAVVLIGILATNPVMQLLLDDFSTRSDQSCLALSCFGSTGLHRT